MQSFGHISPAATAWKSNEKSVVVQDLCCRTHSTAHVSYPPANSRVVKDLPERIAKGGCVVQQWTAQWAVTH